MQEHMRDVSFTIRRDHGTVFPCVFESIIPCKHYYERLNDVNWMIGWQGFSIDVCLAVLLMIAWYE